VIVLIAATSPSGAIKPSEAERLASGARVLQEVRSLIPRDIFGKARCVMVLPGVKKAAFVVGGEYGRGMMSCRSGERWSPPVFMQLAKGSWGFQAGVQEVDLMLLVMNESGAQKLLNNKVALGADASVAAGPIGTGGAVATDAVMTAEILSYSRARGLFAGIDLSGGVLRPDEDVNKTVYGPTASVRTILAGTEISAPPEAAPFLAALSAAAPISTASSAAPAAPAASSTAVPKTTPPPAPVGPVSPVGDDVRAQLTAMLQMLDSMLANTQPAPVGTSGTADAAPTSIAVDRAQLLRLRQQIDALLAGVNRR
jgi:SH3 domain-containing YSC84-like protein 1